MPSLLQLDSSADLVHSHSRAITSAFADAWRARGADYTVVVRDLHRTPPPHLSDAALHWPARLRSAEGTPAPDDEALQAQLIAELLAADAVVVGAPLYNYSMPSTLKAWIDHIHVPGVTANFDVEAQPMAGRPAVIVTSRGGSYDAGSATDGWDHDVPALDLILGASLGMTVSVITTSLTLAQTVPSLADQKERADAEFAAALAAAADLGGRV